MAVDCYSRARDIIGLLESNGLAADAAALRDVMAAGATGTEILMGLRWHLERICREDRALGAVADERIRRLLAELNRALA